MSDADEPPDSPVAVTSASTERAQSQTGASPADDPTNASAAGTSLLGTYSALAPLQASVLTTTYTTMTYLVLPISCGTLGDDTSFLHDHWQ